MKAKKNVVSREYQSCPGCGAKEGKRCRRPNGEKVDVPHWGRVKIGESDPPALGVPVHLQPRDMARAQVLAERSGIRLTEWLRSTVEGEIAAEFLNE